MVNAVVREAERDAVAVAELLSDLGFRRPSPGSLPLRLPAAFLLGVGAAMRLFRWEERGVQIHRTAGLGAAGEVLCEVVRRTAPPSAQEPDPAVARLLLTVFELAVQWMAWEGQPVLGADVVVGGVDDEDAFVEALTQLCWARRRTQGVQSA